MLSENETLIISRTVLGREPAVNYDAGPRFATSPVPINYLRVFTRRNFARAPPDGPPRIKAKKTSFAEKRKKRGINKINEAEGEREEGWGGEEANVGDA